MSPFERLSAARLVGVVREGDGDRAAAIARGLVQGGLQAVEITTNTPRAFETVAELATRHPEVTWGVGTVLSVAHVERAAAAGASFTVSPHFDPELVRAALDAGLLPIPGALTPTEIHAAHAAGAPVVKVFPVSAVGGPAFVRWLRGPRPDLPLWVSGDVSLDEIGAYIEAGATLIGLTSALTRDLTGSVEAAAAERAAAAQARRARAEAADEPFLVLTAARSLRPLRSELSAEGSFEPLEGYVPGRVGRVVRLRPWLERAGFEASGLATVRSVDGFEAVVPVQLLLDGGAVQLDEAGAPLSAARGGPFRLFVKGGEDRCSNIKGLAEIASAQPV